MTAEPLRPYTVLYDGDCGVCRRLATKLEAMDNRGVFELVPYQRRDVRERFPWISEAACAAALQLVRNSDNRTWEGAAAVEQVTRQLRAGRIVSWLFAIPFGRRIADALYRWFANHRRELGCGDHCRVSDNST